jgi:LysM repeat protein
MLSLGRLRLSLTTALLVAGAAGCLPAGSNQQEEEQEPHYVLGSSRVKAMDYDGAVEAFEESLEVDPHSAAAHFELGWLFDEKVTDPAAAIYHYQEYLKYNPKADNAQIILQRINSCKQQLAANSLELPSSSAAQQQLQHLVEKNQQLNQQVEQLQGIIKQWNAYYASQQAALANQPRQPAANPQPLNDSSPGPDDISANPGGTASLSPAVPVVATNLPRNSAHANATLANASARGARHLHNVQPGETLASIARKSAVSLNALLAANPSLNPKKLHVGQSVVIP